jgi:hypothetical protein
MYMIGAWKVLTKAGEKGWKSIIPFLNTYTVYKISWSGIMYWVSFALCIAGIVCGIHADGSSALSSSGFYLLFIAAAVISFINKIKLSKAFGHGIGFGLGLFFFNPLFTIILGFDSSEYRRIR